LWLHKGFAAEVHSGRIHSHITNSSKINKGLTNNEIYFDLIPLQCEISKANKEYFAQSRKQVIYIIRKSSYERNVRVIH